VEVGGVVKMSKTKRNTVEPDEIIDKYGVDTARLFVLFAAPPEGQLDWNDAGVEGAQRFLQRVWRLVSERRDPLSKTARYRQGALGESAADLRRAIHRTIQRVTYDLSDRCQPNTAIAAQMELVNALTAFEPHTEADWSVVREGVEVLLHLLSPFAPHIADELYEALGGQDVLLRRPWPELDASALQESSVEIPVQINGKLRGRIRVAPHADEQTVMAAAKAVPQIAERLASKTIKKTVYVPGRILTLVVSD
jgi:leucyl-tRNA synthetase